MRLYDINKLKVLRKTDIGYILLDNDNNEIFMHFNETTLELKDNDVVDAFIFHDSKKRIACTTNEVNVTISKAGFTEVKDVNYDLGVFLDNNCSKDLLLGRNYLSYDHDLWPQPKDKLLIVFKDSETSARIRLRTKEEIIELSDFSKRHEVGDLVNAYVCKITNSGIGLVTNSFKYIFVHNTQMRNSYRLGEEVTAKILYVKEFEYIGSLNERKEHMIDSDKKIILNYLKSHNNKMPYSSKSTSEEISRVFKISKKAFKRALGGLYKDKIVDCSDTETILIKEE